MSIITFVVVCAKLKTLSSLHIIEMSHYNLVSLFFVVVTVITIAVITVHHYGY